VSSRTNGPPARVALGALPSDQSVCLISELNFTTGSCAHVVPFTGIAQSVSARNRDTPYLQLIKLTTESRIDCGMERFRSVDIHIMLGPTD
jgi:hypothetical protein